MSRSRLEAVKAEKPSYDPSMSRLIIASILSASLNERFRKYHEPARDCLEAPNATKSTERLKSMELVLTIEASSIIIARPEALPFAPEKTWVVSTPSMLRLWVPRLSRRAPTTIYLSRN